jgi:hypothetical protein
MKKLFIVFAAMALMLLGSGAVFGQCGDCEYYKQGHVWLDGGDGDFSGDDIPLEGVKVIVTDEAGNTYEDVTDENGFYKICLPGKGSYVEKLDESTIPQDCYLVPVEEYYEFELTCTHKYECNKWLLCEEGLCWLTGGGVKFEPLVGDRMAEYEKGPSDSIGGNVYPGCNPDSGDGGQWNHVAHKLKLHFQGWTIQVVECGNVPGIDPGSDSPKTPYNYIEFMGTGTLKGIHGNKLDPKVMDVAFYARCEDRNEPGSKGAKDGALVDRYYLHVYDPVTMETLLLIDEDGVPDPMDPVLITGGNLQLHISSCDNPPE